MGDVERMGTAIQQGFLRYRYLHCIGFYLELAAGYSEREIVYLVKHVIRILNGNYPRHSFDQYAFPDSHTLNIGCEDERHLVLFDADLGFEAWGVEPTEKLAEIAQGNVESVGADVTVRAGENRRLPFKDDKFDFLFAWNSYYYMGESHDYDSRRTLRSTIRCSSPVEV
jgi:hypothetical protein